MKGISTGEIYKANVLKNMNFQNYDLAILQFYSIKKSYSVANLGSVPKIGDEVFIAGFPVGEESEKINFVYKFPESSQRTVTPVRGVALTQLAHRRQSLTALHSLFAVIINRRLTAKWSKSA